MLDTITKYINMMIEKINNMIIDNGRGNGNGKESSSLMKGLQTIIILIALAYIFAKLISVFQFHINYTF
jgi:hypothetical protein